MHLIFNSSTGALVKEAPSDGGFYRECVYKGYKKKGLQSRCATASLLIKNHQCMK